MLQEPLLAAWGCWVSPPPHAASYLDSVRLGRGPHSRPSTASQSLLGPRGRGRGMDRRLRQKLLLPLASSQASTGSVERVQGGDPLGQGVTSGNQAAGLSQQSSGRLGWGRRQEWPRSQCRADSLPRFIQLSLHGPGGAATAGSAYPRGEEKGVTSLPQSSLNTEGGKQAPVGDCGSSGSSGRRCQAPRS